MQHGASSSLRSPSVRYNKNIEHKKDDAAGRAARAAFLLCCRWGEYPRFVGWLLVGHTEYSAVVSVPRQGCIRVHACHVQALRARCRGCLSSINGLQAGVGDIACCFCKYKHQQAWFVPTQARAGDESWL